MYNKSDVKSLVKSIMVETGRQKSDAEELYEKFMESFCMITADEDLILPRQVRDCIMRAYEALNAAEVHRGSLEEALNGIVYGSALEDAETVQSMVIDKKLRSMNDKYHYSAKISN